MNELYQKITITIVLYNESFNAVYKCLEKVKNFKIIIIDNNNDKRLKKKIEENFKIYSYTINKKNLGFSKALNQAIRLSDSEYILNLESDCLIDETDIMNLYNALKKYPNSLIVTPTMYNEDGKLTHSGGTFIEKNMGYKVLNLEGDTCVDFPLTAAILFKKQDMIKIGMFDEDLFIYYPDIEIGRRIKDNNKSVIQIYRSKAVHQMGKLKINNPIKRVFFRNYFYTYDGLIYFFKKDYNLKPFYELQKNIFGLMITSILSIFLLRFAQSIESFSKVLAYYKFKFFYLKKKNR